MTVSTACLTGMEHVNRYWDRHAGCTAAKILPGQYYVTREPEFITTVLGSCISVCVYEPSLGLGGMNHFMLPGGKGEDLSSDSFRYGDVAMARLINELFKLGAKRSQLVFKAFGGSQVIRNMTAIGQSNIAFLDKFMTLEGYHLSASDLGGVHPRKIKFFPKTGQVWVKKLEHMHNDTIIRRENRYKAFLSNPEEMSGEIDLFE